MVERCLTATLSKDDVRAITFSDMPAIARVGKVGIGDMDQNGEVDEIR
jgi:hypothetical protein